MTATSQFVKLSAAIEQCGFVARGGFHVDNGEQFPGSVRSVVLVGSQGRGGFEAFRASPEWGISPDPLDRYCERVLGDLARELGVRIVFPQHGPPWWPFQQWAARAETIYPSPLQILIHPQYGLWHSWRAALLFCDAVQGLPTRVRESKADAGGPCQRCARKPCLSACPVDAFANRKFDRGRCEQHLRSDAGRECMERGCIARNACPVAPHARYSREQQQFHMREFLR